MVLAYWQPWTPLLPRVSPLLHGLWPPLHVLQPLLRGLQRLLHGVQPPLHRLQPLLHGLQPILLSVQPHSLVFSLLCIVFSMRSHARNTSMSFLNSYELMPSHNNHKTHVFQCSSAGGCLLKWLMSQTRYVTSSRIAACRPCQQASSHHQHTSLVLHGSLGGACCCCQSESHRPRAVCHCQ